MWRETSTQRSYRCCQSISRATAEGTWHFCLWLLFLHFHQKVFTLFLAVRNTDTMLCSESAVPECDSNTTRALGRGGDRRQGKSAGMPQWAIAFSAPICPHTRGPMFGSSWPYLPIRSFILTIKEELNPSDSAPACQSASAFCLPSLQFALRHYLASASAQHGYGCWHAISSTASPEMLSIYLPCPRVTPCNE